MVVRMTRNRQRQVLKSFGAAWAGPPPRPGGCGTAEHQVKYRCQLMPPRKEGPALGDQIEGMRHLTTRTSLYSFFSWNGEMRGVRGRALSPWAHNAGAADKARGQPGRMFDVNTSYRAAIASIRGR